MCSSDLCSYLLASFLAEAGDPAAAEQACAATLTQAREAGDLYTLGLVLPVMADLDVQAGRVGDATAHLREAAKLSLQTVNRFAALNVLDACGYLCAATGRHAETITVWAAVDTLSQQGGVASWEPDVHRREEALHQAQRVLGPDRARTAQQRGAAIDRKSVV